MDKFLLFDRDGANMKAGLRGMALLILVFLAACNFPAIPQPVGPLSVLPTDTPQPPPPLSVPAEYLTDAKVVSHDPFNNMLNWKIRNETATLTNGMVEINGTAFWHGGILYKQRFNEGEGLMLRFKVQNASGNSEFVFVSGEWLKDSFKQFGLYASTKPKADLFQGTTNAGGYDVMGNLDLQTDAWYNLLMAIGHDGHFLAVIWDPNNEAQRAIYDLIANASWVSQSWQFLPKVNEGETVNVDDFYKLTFGDIK